MADGEVWILVFSLLDGMSLLFLTVYFIITLSDLECDYINATSCCKKLNRWVVPELIAHGTVTALMFLTWHYVLFLLNAPLLAWQVYRYVYKPSGNIGIYDPAEIHNRQLLKGYMKESMIKLGYHLIFFFFYLYTMIISLLS